jgi:hypothetical protein
MSNFIKQNNDFLKDVGLECYLVSIVTKAQTNTINLEKESAIPGDPILLERK